MTLLTDEMIAAAAEESKNAPQSSKPSGKSAGGKSVAADFATDPIDYTISLRMQDGGLTNQKTKQDAAKEKL